MAIPTRILEEIKNSELDAENFYSIYGKENIEAALNDLKKSDEEILNTYSVEAMKAAVSAKMNQKKAAGNIEAKNNILQFPTATRFISYAAAAVLLAAIVIPAGLKNSKIKAGSTIPTERVKGVSVARTATSPAINLYRQKGREVQALNNGDFARSGDVIQITYNAGAEEYGVIFSVDGNGNVTRHFPENSWQAGQLVHRNDETPLDFSYELDNAPDFECFIMVTSKKRFSLENLESAIKNKTDIDYLTELSYLPKKTEGITFTLEK
jgi:hypothetical protein